MVVFDIEIVSDPICSWCYIGHRKLLQAISLYKKTYPGGRSDSFILTYRPYYLIADASGPSVDKQTFQDTIMSAEHQKLTFRRMTLVGRANGICFKYGGKIGGTREAHRLLYLCQTRKSVEVRDQVVERIFQAFHEREMDISDKNVLRAIAMDAGVDEEEVNEWLNSDLGGSEVDDEIVSVRETFGDGGVPVFFIQGKHRVDGAQDPMEFMEIFEQVKNEEQ